MLGNLVLLTNKVIRPINSVNRVGQGIVKMENKGTFLILNDEILKSAPRWKYHVLRMEEFNRQPKSKTKRRATPVKKEEPTYFHVFSDV